MESRKANILMDLLERELDRAEGAREPGEGHEDGEGGEPGGNRQGSIIQPGDKERWNTPANVEDLARLVMSEASTGNRSEQTAVA